MSSAAITLYPKLLLRARELTGASRADLDAEDLVGIALLAMVAKPPEPKTLSQLHHWLRTVLRNTNARRFRDLGDVELVSWDAIEEARAGRGVTE